MFGYETPNKITSALINVSNQVMSLQNIDLVSASAGKYPYFVKVMSPVNMQNVNSTLNFSSTC